ncbi:hypothetical protein P154DRAFT_524626 [Amniculicola lignicola CBS 123094]|uniref:Uncharacterized protein n=1 Tax=Amniculicola lignicola CBS 123094 TaxID=1392246 RepID=A0A6A5W9W1_9PLEO|nr:hypothetical protein P154DRAFT_524626 [Amniculicola lignicola CBS 123094]
MYAASGTPRNPQEPLKQYSHSTPMMAVRHTTRMSISMSHTPSSMEALERLATLCLLEEDEACDAGRRTR